MVLNTFYKAFFGIDIDKDYINPNLFDMVAAYDIFMITAKYSPNFAGARYYNMCYAACADIKFNITDISKSGAVSAIDNFFFTEFGYAHTITFFYMKHCNMQAKPEHNMQQRYSWQNSYCLIGHIPSDIYKNCPVLLYAEGLG